MKKLLILLICVSLSFAFAVPTFASCGDDNGPQKYISRVYGLGYYGFTYFSDACSCCDIENNKDNVVGNAIKSSTDFNKGCGGDSAYIRMMQEFTTDRNAAITNLCVLYEKYYSGTISDFYLDGCLYYVVPGYVVVDGDGLFGIKKVVCDQFTFNEHDIGEEDDCKNEVYLFYTTDPRAGAPITKLNILMGEKHANDANLVKVFHEENAADFNKGYGDTRIYLQMERASSQTGSIFNDSTSVIIVSVGAAVIIAAVVIVVVTSKKRKKADK